jgi:predicted TPR repeat methyltransferase
MNASVEQPGPHDILSRVYDRWSARGITIGGASWPSVPEEPDLMLDARCGTGTPPPGSALTGVRNLVGIDASAAMLDVAARKIREQGLAGSVRFERLDVAHDPWPNRPFDLVTCTFDSVNYFSIEAFSAIARKACDRLAAGGLFVFDINTEHKLRTVFGHSVYAETFDDYAYIWKNALDEQAGTIDFTITMFLRQAAGLYERHVEAHRQYLHSDRSVRTALGEAGFASVDARDDYSELPPHEASLRLTYVAQRSA